MSKPIVNKPTFRRDIEGLRALAVTAVVAYHAQLPGFSGGFVGVDVFFVLSGYLITWLLTHELTRDGSLNLREFYARRARRLLPALALTLLFVVTASSLVFAPLEQLHLTETALFTSLYASNVHFALDAVDYLGSEQHQNPLLHTWSLSIEEQFYLLWPMLVALAARPWRSSAPPSRKRMLTVLGALTLASFVASVALTFHAKPLAFFFSPTRAWEFGIGALALLVPTREESHSWRNALALAGLVVLGACCVLLDDSSPFPGLLALAPTLSTVALLRAHTPGRESALSRALGLGLAQALGRWSYSWYLWHWPLLVFAVALGIADSAPQRALVAALSLLPAYASFKLVERPLRHHPRIAGSHSASFALAMWITLFGVGTSKIWQELATSWSHSNELIALKEDTSRLPDIAPECRTPLLETTPKFCRSSPEKGQLDVVVFGDSHAEQWLPTLSELARRNGWNLTNVTKPACPIPRHAKEIDHLGRPHHECLEWHPRALDAIDAMSPDLVITSQWGEYMTDHEEWEEATFATLTRLSAASTKTVVIREVPVPVSDTTTCIARAQWHSLILPMTPNDCTYPTHDPATSTSPTSQRAATLRAVERAERVDAIDPYRWLCPTDPCPALTERGTAVFRDNCHISVPTALELADELERALEPFIPEPKTR